MAGMGQGLIGRPQTIESTRRPEIPLSRVRSEVMVFLAQLAEAGGARPPPCTFLYPLHSSYVVPPARLARDSYLYSPISPGKKFKDVGKFCESSRNFVFETSQAEGT